MKPRACRGDGSADGTASGTDTSESSDTTEDTGTTGEPVAVDLNGAVNKGPFVLGSSLDISPLDGSGNPTGEVFQTSTISDLGEFAVNFTASGLVRIEGNGFYYNEVTGGLSTAPITLRALYEITESGEQAAYVNLITHLSHSRIIKLIGDGLATVDAIAQAEDELRTALSIGPADLDVSASGIELSITGGDDLGNAYLFAVSSVVAQAAIERAGPEGSVDAALQELVNGISVDLQADGELSSATVQALADAEAALDPERVMQLLGRRLATLGSTEPIPDINRVIDSDDDGVVNRDDNCRWIANPDQSPITDQVCLVLADSAGESVDVSMSFAGDAMIVDMDGDGVMEVVTSRYNVVRVFEVSADGALNEVSSRPGIDLVFLDQADVNGDGIPDLVGLAPGMTGGVVVMVGDGTLQPTTPVLTTGVVQLGDWADLTGDGNDDMISPVSMGSFTGTTAQLTHKVAISAGDGTFTVEDRVTTISTTGLTADPAYIGAADVTGDGSVDLVYIAPSQAGGQLIVAAGDGTGNFAAPTYTVLPGNVVFGALGPEGEVFHLVDADGDGTLDLAGFAGGQLHVFAGNGSGTFAMPVTSPFGGGFDVIPQRLGFGDVTGDGVIDVVVVSTDGQLVISVGQGQGAFAAPISVANELLQTAEGTGFGDVDGNGTMDLVTVLAPTSPALVGVFRINP
jgi:hypothetical protein